MKAKEFIIELKKESKPRNFVAKNAKMGGAGQHKDKKKAEKQGDVKHKQKQFSEGVVEGGEYNEFKVGQRATYKNSRGQEFPVIVTAVDFDEDAVKVRSADNKPFPNSGGDLEIVVDPGWKFLTPTPGVDPNSIIAVSPNMRKTTERVGEGSKKIPFAGEKVGHKEGPAGQLKGTDPKGYPKGKLVGGGM